MLHDTCVDTYNGNPGDVNTSRLNAFLNKVEPFSARKFELD